MSRESMLANNFLSGMMTLPAIALEPYWVRTSDPYIRSVLLYPAELTVHFKGRLAPFFLLEVPVSPVKHLHIVLFKGHRNMLNLTVLTGPNKSHVYGIALIKTLDPVFRTSKRPTNLILVNSYKSTNKRLALPDESHENVLIFHNFSFNFVRFSITY